MTQLRHAAKGYEPTFQSRADCMGDVLRQLDALARDAYAVLLHGPSGAGKECMARYYALRAVEHRTLERGRTFLVLNCSCLTGEIALTELFGIEAGTFDLPEKPGAFEICEEGLLFLDEIGDLPQEAQPQLLRALGSDGEYRRIGGVDVMPVTTRVIAATNRPLADLRPDLRARLGHVIEVPGLDQRKEDIIPAIERFARRTLKARKDRSEHSLLERDATIDELVEDFVSRVEPHALSCRWDDNFRGVRRATEFALCVASPARRADLLTEAVRLFQERAGAAPKTTPFAKPTPVGGTTPPTGALAQRIVTELGDWGSGDADREKLASYITATEGRPFQASAAAKAAGTCVNTVYNALKPLVAAGILDKPGTRRPYRLKAQPEVYTPAVTPTLRPPSEGRPDAELSAAQRGDVESLCELLNGARRVFLAGERETGRTTVALAVARRLGGQRPVLWWAFRQVESPSERGTFSEFMDAMEEGLVMHGAPVELALGEQGALEPDELRAARLAGYIGPGFGRRPLLILDAVDHCLADPLALTICLRYWTAVQLLLVGTRLPNLVGDREGDGQIAIREYVLTE